MLIELATLCLLIALGVLSWIDWKTLRLPNAITLPLIAVGLAVSAWRDLLIPALIGAIAGYLVLFLVETLYRRTRDREGLGRGDAKLLAAGGAWCAWWSLPYILLVASLSGLIAAGLSAWLQKKPLGLDAKLPFGPFLGLGIALLWIVNAYWPDLVQFP